MSDHTIAKASSLKSSANSLLDFPVFLCGHRKSGTTMLLALLDSHPELLTYPADSAFFYRVYPPCFQNGGGDPVLAVQQYTIRENLTTEMKKAQVPGLFDIEGIARRFG